MNNENVLAKILIVGLVVGVGFNTLATAAYTEPLSNVAQTIEDVEWTVEIGGLNTKHTIFPGDIISEDTLSLTNANSYSVIFNVNLTSESSIFNEALELSLQNGSNNIGVYNPNGSIDIVVAANSELNLTSYIKWDENKFDIDLAGENIIYNYDVIASKRVEGSKVVVYSNQFDTEKSIGSWIVDGTPADSLAYIEGQGMKVKNRIITSFGGYRTDGVVEWSNETDLDLTMLENLEGFNYSMAINSKENICLENFVFNVYKDEEGIIHLNADTDLRNEVPSFIVGKKGTITTTEQALTLTHNFYPNEKGNMISEMTIKDSNKNVVFNKSIIGSSNYDVSDVGGYRYGYFSAMGKNEEGRESSGLVNGFIIKSSVLEINPIEQKLASNFVVTEWGDSSIVVDFNINEELDLGVLTENTDVVIKYYCEGAVITTFDKSKSGYLRLDNDINKKYPKGMAQNDKYEDILEPGRYSISVNMDYLRYVDKIVVTVIDSKGNETILKEERP